MVNQTNMDIIMSTIVAIIAPPAQPRNIDQKDLQQVLTRPTVNGQSPAGLLVSSQRDQIEVIVSGKRIDARDLSGESRFSDSKVPSALHFFVGSRQINSYGVNFIITLTF